MEGREGGLGREAAVVSNKITVGLFLHGLVGGWVGWRGGKGGWEERLL